jgi:thioredoxin 1
MIFRQIFLFAPVLFMSIAPLSCGKTKQESEGQAGVAEVSVIHGITSEDEFQRIVDGSGSRLLAFDLYANWCMPCRMLAPVLEKIAVENSSRVTFFKINLEKLPGVSQTFHVNGIPHVAFIKNKAVVETVVGMQPEQTYLDIISRYSAQ